MNFADKIIRVHQINKELDYKIRFLESFTRQIKKNYKNTDLRVPRGDVQVIVGVGRTIHKLLCEKEELLRD